VWSSGERRERRAGGRERSREEGGTEREGEGGGGGEIERRSLKAVYMYLHVGHQNYTKDAIIQSSSLKHNSTIKFAPSN
jgi:hypothetical protein